MILTAIIYSVAVLAIFVAYVWCERCNGTAATIRIEYKCVDGWHVYTSVDLPGLYVASQDASEALRDLLPAVYSLIELDKIAKQGARA